MIQISKLTPERSVLEAAQGCKMCGSCCKHSSGFFLAKEIPKIAKQLKMDTKKFMDKYLDEVKIFNTTLHRPKLRGKPYGACVFYDEKRKCTIHSIKPLHCRIGTCNENGQQTSEWFTLNYLVNADDPNSIREWAARLKTHPTIPGGELHELVDDETLKKMLNYEDLR